VVTSVVSCTTWDADYLDDFDRVSSAGGPTPPASRALTARPHVARPIVSVVPYKHGWVTTRTFVDYTLYHGPIKIRSIIVHDPIKVVQIDRHPESCMIPLRWPHVAARARISFCPGHVPKERLDVPQCPFCHDCPRARCMASRRLPHQSGAVVVRLVVVFGLRIVPRLVLVLSMVRSAPSGH